jgi:hypothetical protein
MKICNKCKCEKPLSDFYHQTKPRTDYKPTCKQCHKNISRKWAIENPKKISLHQEKYRNGNLYSETRSKWVEQNKDKINDYVSRYQERHRDLINKRSMEWRKENPEKVKEITKRSNDKRMGTIKGRLINSISCSIRNALSNGLKRRRPWESLVGYTVEQLKSHLEELFTDGMSWANYGEWNIDHIIPISAFNFMTPDDIDFKRCWSLTNLRPMWASENFRKRNKLYKPFQPALAISA